MAGGRYVPIVIEGLRPPKFRRCNFCVFCFRFQALAFSCPPCFCLASQHCLTCIFTEFDNTCYGRWTIRSNSNGFNWSKIFMNGNGVAGNNAHIKSTEKLQCPVMLPTRHNPHPRSAESKQSVGGSGLHLQLKAVEEYLSLKRATGWTCILQAVWVITLVQKMECIAHCTCSWCRRRRVDTWRSTPAYYKTW